MIRYENTWTIRNILENVVEEYNNATFLRYEGEDNIIYDISFNEFYSHCRAVGAFINEMRTRKSRPIKVALFGSASVNYITTLVGIMASGNIAIPLDCQLDISSLIGNLEKSDADILFYDHQYESLIREVKKSCSEINAYYSLQPVNGVPCLNDILTNEKYSCESWSVDGTKYPVSPEDLAIIIFTSGTTGISKGVMLTHGNIVGNQLSSKHPDYGKNRPTLLNILPIHHSYCISSDIIGTLVKGGILAINGPLSQLERHLKLFEPTHIYMAPMIAKVLYNKIHSLATFESSLSKEEALHRVYGKNIRYITCGGGGLSADLAKNYAKLGVKIGQGYGMTECSPVISEADFERLDKIESAGHLVKHVEARISDEGEIQVRSPFVMKGYCKEPEMTAEAFTEDRWLKTGDIGYIDDEDFIYIQGRVNNIIILSNGENVVPEEIELGFMTEPLIKDILVYGEDDVIKCEVYPNFKYSDANNIKDITTTVEDIIKKHNKQLPDYKKIMVVHVRKTKFKKTTSKKIIRNEFFKEQIENKPKKADYMLPETEEQKKVYDLCCQCLGHNEFGVNTNLYTSGLDSFSSIMLLQDINDNIGTSLTLTELIENPTIEQICNKLYEKSHEQNIDYSVREIYPLTNQQRYFTYVMRGNTTTNLPFFFKLNRDISLDKMECAMKKLFEIHPILKDRIELGDDQQYYNFRNDNREVNIERLSFTKEEWEEKKQHLIIPYNYEKGDDLYHIGLYEVEGDKYLFFDVCHSISDGESMIILLNDLNNLYLGNKVKKLNYTFYEYILDEHAREATGVRENNIKTYEELLNGFEINKSILAKKDSYDLTTAHNASLKGEFKKLDMKNVHHFCKKHGISENALFLSAFSYTIGLYASSDDVIITSTHNGRTEGNWAHIAGSLFSTYVFRYKTIKNETIDQLLKRNAKQILHTMETYMPIKPADEMFIQFQGDLLDTQYIGGKHAELIKIQLDSMPFHFMIHSKSHGYVYELRYWENRFDRDMLEVFIAVMEDVIFAMLTETEVKRIQNHISENLYPRKYELSSLQLNEFVGREIIKNATDNDIVKPYIIDKYGHKKPYGAWGSLHLLGHMVNNGKKNIKSIYTPGILYDTGIKARITPNNKIETFEEAGRTVLRETLHNRFYIDLYKLEETLITHPNIKSARAFTQYGADNMFYVTAVLETSAEIDETEIKTYVSEKLGEYMIPEIIKFCDTP